MNIFVFAISLLAPLAHGENTPFGLPSDPTEAGCSITYGGGQNCNITCDNWSAECGAGLNNACGSKTWLCVVTMADGSKKEAEGNGFGPCRS